MYKALLITLFILLSVTGNAQSQYVSSEWVVVLDDPRPARLKGWQRGQYSGNGHYSHALELKRTKQRVAKKHNLDVHDEWFIESLGVYCLIATFKGDQALTLERLRADKKVKSVQPSNNFALLQSKLLQAVKTNDFDPAFLNPPELRLLQSINGKGATIALIDSAVDQAHPDISAQVIENFDFVGDERKASGGEAHGTAMAGVIAADQQSALGVTGVASGAELKAYRGCWENTTYNSSRDNGTNCNTLTLARALDAVATTSEADILNLSLSGPKDELLDQLISQIVSQGTTVVVAFDPTRSAAERFPSGSLGVVTVRANPLNAGSTRIFSAPGKKIVAAPQNQANFMQGHSVAAAYTSGVLALCTQLERQLNKEICTPSLFEQLKNNNSSNLHQLVIELERELTASTRN